MDRRRTNQPGHTAYDRRHKQLLPVWVIALLVLLLFGGAVADLAAKPPTAAHARR